MAENSFILVFAGSLTIRGGGSVSRLSLKELQGKNQQALY